MKTQDLSTPPCQELREFTPIPGKPYEFASLHRRIDVEPFLKLTDAQSSEDWFKNLDEAMLMLIELQAQSKAPTDGEVLYEIFYCIRLVRDCLKNAVLPLTTPNPVPGC